MLVFDTLSPRIFVDPSLPIFQQIKKEGLVFEKGWVGHLSSHPSTSFEVLITGLFPRTFEFPSSPFLLPPPQVCNSSEDCLTQMEQNPHWSWMIWKSVALENLEAENQLKTIVEFIKQREWLKKTLWVITALRGASSDLSKEVALQIHLKKRTQPDLLGAARKVQRIPGVSEVYYRILASKKSYYIRTYRSSELDAEQLEWAKTRRPLLTASIAHSTAPDIVAFYSPKEEETIQRIPMAFWSPHLKRSNPGTWQQLAQTPARLVDVGPMVLQLLRKENNPELDGNPLGVQSLID